jgi:hypothetical protein
MSDFINSAKEGNLAKVKYYLSQEDINVNETDNRGWTALIGAAWAGHLDVIKVLIAHKAEINKADKPGCTALIWAAWAGHLDVIKELIAHKADVNKADNLGESALILAARNGHLDIVKELIAHKAEINKADNHGCTALIWAADRERIYIVKELLNAGSDLLLKTKSEFFESMIICMFLSDNGAKRTFDRLIKEEGFPGLTAMGKLELLKAFKFMDENSKKFDKWIFTEQIKQTKSSLEVCEPFNVLLDEVANLDVNIKGSTHKLKDGLSQLSFILKHKEQYGINVAAYKAKLQKICKNLEVSTGNKYYEFVEYVEKAQEEVKSILDKLKEGNGQTIGVKDPLSDYLLSLSQDYTKLDGWLPIHNVNETLTRDSLDMLLALPKEILATIIKKMLSTNKSMMDAQESNGVIVKTLCATEIWDDLSTIKSEATELSGLINQAE